MRKGNANGYLILRRNWSVSKLTWSSPLARLTSSGIEEGERVNSRRYAPNADRSCRRWARFQPGPPGGNITGLKTSWHQI